MTVTRWNPLLVALHWIVAVLVILGLVFGLTVLESMPNDPAKMDPLRIHVIAGLAIGVLMILRILVRLFTRRPPKSGSGKRLFNALRAAVHVLLYLVVLSMISTGVGIALLSGLFDILFGAGGTLPESFDAFAPRQGHEFFAGVLMVLVLIHVLAALYHQFALKDGLIRRMWFGRSR